MGHKKVEALTDHLRAIWPEVMLVPHDVTLKPEDVAVLFAEADLLVEAFESKR